MTRPISQECKRKDHTACDGYVPRGFDEPHDKECQCECHNETSDTSHSHLPTMAKLPYSRIHIPPFHALPNPRDITYAQLPRPTHWLNIDSPDMDCPGEMPNVINAPAAVPKTISHSPYEMCSALFQQYAPKPMTITQMQTTDRIP